jgi:hypothetical protein
MTAMLDDEDTETQREYVDRSMPAEGQADQVGLRAGETPPPPPKRPTANAVPPKDDSNELANRMKAAVAKIAEAPGTPTQATATITAFLRHIASPLRKKAQQDFPTTIRPHPLNKEHSQYSGTKWSLLCFHIGNAILGYYDYLLGKFPLDNLEERIKLLENIAVKTINMYRRSGSDSKGYFLHPCGVVSLDEINDQRILEELELKRTGVNTKKIGD